jgi:hypothetical protein
MLLGNFTGDLKSVAGNITVTNVGAFTANGSITARASRDANIPKLSFNGTDSSGAFSVSGDIDLRRTGTGAGTGELGFLSIADYSSVNIAGSVRSDNSSAVGGPITVSGIIGDIRIAGDINLDGSSSANEGDLSLATANGGISLGGFDLDLVRYVKLDFKLNCIVTGAVLNVATNYISGSGQRMDPYITAQTDLRCPDGRRISYHPECPGNSYLNGRSYRVADLSGTAGSGGILTPYVGRGTVITLR